MKKLTLLILFLSLASVGFSQYTVSRYVNNFNGFQRTNENDPDSALFFLRNLATLEPNSTDELLHNSFAQRFLIFSETKLFASSEFLATLKSQHVTIDSARRKFKEMKQSAYKILAQIKNDPNAELKANAYPILQWVEAQDNLTNSTKLKAIGTEYIRYLNSTTDFYTQRKARYGLLIAKLLYNNNKLRPDADRIIELIYNNLQNHQITEDPTTVTRPAKEKRAWYRYMFAYCNFITSQNLKLTKNQKLERLKLAFSYSPDILDKTFSNAYFYDMIFLFGNEKYSFEEDYLAALGSDEEKFKTIMVMSMNDPSFKQKAKELYKGQANFDDYWLSEFNKKFASAPLFSLKQVDGNQYVLGNNKNQWTLIDFWGTWCSPCRKEHPDLQKLYLDTKDGKMKRLNIITIASEDQEHVVKKYMESLNYSFPVVMSDNQIEKKYNVSSWPSKFLVSPQGKYVVIPFNVDWQKYIEDYIN
ncbi:TlpA family protein disulfide reductase [Pedobacter sp. KLB.chiD]|uniref:TlpA family protein disulfide reductase n=1 Tax=Pedobacter sp. KLB.chiD TaxID=3387402 RepID=UPI00399B1BDE